MGTTTGEIQQWLAAGKLQGATHMLVACDSFDHEDYPVYVKPGEDPRERAKNLGEMQRVMECYAYHLDLGAQIREYRAFHWEMPTPTMGQALRLVKEGQSEPEKAESFLMAKNGEAKHVAEKEKVVKKNPMLGTVFLVVGSNSNPIGVFDDAEDAEAAAVMPFVRGRVVEVARNAAAPKENERPYVVTFKEEGGKLVLLKAVQTDHPVSLLGHAARTSDGIVAVLWGTSASLIPDALEWAESLLEKGRATELKAKV